LLKVEYKGSEPPPDTFKDDSQALAEGSYGRDGESACDRALQAKCASKYAPATTEWCSLPLKESRQTPRHRAGRLPRLRQSRRRQTKCPQD
jgi:cytochrome c-type biogenesis protein CcmE